MTACRNPASKPKSKQKNSLISAKLFFYNSVKYNSLIFDGSHWRVPADVLGPKKKKKRLTSILECRVAHGNVDWFDTTDCRHDIPQMIWETHLSWYLKDSTVYCCQFRPSVSRGYCDGWIKENDVLHLSIFPSVICFWTIPKFNIRAPLFPAGK